MHTSPARRLLGAAFLLALLPLAAGCDDNDPDDGTETTVTVMSRNLYLGGDLFTLLDPACEGDAIVGCVAQLYFGSVVASDIPGRMGAVAEEIEANDPDLIGLQEVSLYRTQTPSDYLTGTLTPNASNVTFDFLQILQDSLAARGLDYEVVATNTNADVEFPSTLDGVTFTDIRLTDRDVILARSGLQTQLVREFNFPLNITAVIPVGGVDVPFTRGFSEVLVTKDDVTFTFANVHLEVGGEAAPAQRAQAAYLAGDSGFGDTEPLILLGDFNADPDPEDEPLFTDGYATLIAAFSDAWTTLRTSDTGYTCCFAANLDPDADTTLEQRIDLVLYQGDVQPVEIDRIGEEPGDQTETGLWPSDHVGVVSTLTVGG